MFNKYAVLLDKYIKSVIDEESLKLKDGVASSASVSDGYIDVKYENGKHRKLRPGKAIREIVEDNLSDHRLGDLVNRILYRYNKDHYQQQYKFKIVNNVEHYYRYDKTVMENELGNSCMIYDPENPTGKVNAQMKEKLLKWYSENGVKLLVLLNEDDKVVARTILWDVTKKPDPSDTTFTVHDRIYHSSENTKEMMLDYLKSNNIKFVRDIGVVYFKIKNPNYEHKPFFDSMKKENDGYLESYPKCIDAIKSAIRENSDLSVIFEKYSDLEIKSSLKKAVKNIKNIYIFLIKSVLYNKLDLIEYIISSFPVTDFLSSPEFINTIAEITCKTENFIALKKLISLGFNINANNGAFLKKVIENDSFIVTDESINKLGANVNVIDGVLYYIHSDRVFNILLNSDLVLTKKDVLSYLNHAISNNLQQHSLYGLVAEVFSYSVYKKLINKEEITKLLKNTTDEKLKIYFLHVLNEHQIDISLFDEIFYEIDPKIMNLNLGSHFRLLNDLSNKRSSDFIFNWLSKHDIDIDYLLDLGLQLTNIFRWSSENNNFNFIKNSPPSKKRICLNKASELGYLNIVKYLVDNGVEISDSIFYLVIKNKRYNVLEFFLDRGLFPMTGRDAADHYKTAVDYGDPNIIRLFIKYGADVVSEIGKEYGNSYAEKLNKLMSQ